jgi:hypothetical protein
MDRRDTRPAYFGIGKDLDPTRTPVDRGEASRHTIQEYAKHIRIDQTKLTDASGNRLTFSGAFWNGTSSIKAGTTIGFYEGEIVTQCNATEESDAKSKPSEYSLEIKSYHVLVDATKPEKTSWTRFVNDGNHNREMSLVNAKFGDDGSIFTTKNIMPGDEIYVSYGASFWDWFA